MKTVAKELVWRPQTLPCPRSTPHCHCNYRARQHILQKWYFSMKSLTTIMNQKKNVFSIKIRLKQFLFLYKIFHILALFCPVNDQNIVHRYSIQWQLTMYSILWWCGIYSADGSRVEKWCFNCNVDLTPVLMTNFFYQ